jgi:hypothetical protein
MLPWGYEDPPQDVIHSVDLPRPPVNPDLPTRIIDLAEYE